MVNHRLDYAHLDNHHSSAMGDAELRLRFILVGETEQKTFHNERMVTILRTPSDLVHEDNWE